MEHQQQIKSSKLNQIVTESSVSLDYVQGVEHHHPTICTTLKRRPVKNKKNIGQCSKFTSPTAIQSLIKKTASECVLCAGSSTRAHFSPISLL